MILGTWCMMHNIGVLQYRTVRYRSAAEEAEEATNGFGREFCSALSERVIFLLKNNKQAMLRKLKAKGSRQRSRIERSGLVGLFNVLLQRYSITVEIVVGLELVHDGLHTNLFESRPRHQSQALKVLGMPPRAPPPLGLRGKPPNSPTT